MQLSLLGDETNETEPGRSGPEPKPLRDYQRSISQQALNLLAQRKSPLTVAATGTGKTRIAAAVVRAYPGRVLWIAHRIELVQQAILALSEILGEPVDVEHPDSYSADRRVVVASKDTIRSPKRLDRLKNFKPFDLICIDEAHHSAARSYQGIAAAYPAALRYGLTATPGRLDRATLGLFDSATEPFGIVQAMQQGWLVPIRAKRERIKTVDLSGVSTVAGDFNKAELDAVMRSEANLHAIAQAVLDRLDHGPCLHFATSVDVAVRQCEVFNRYREGVARVVTGTTPDLERKRTFTDFGRQYSILVNVGVATEGTDLPAAAIVSMGRPTKSTALFQQMLGRGLRPLPGAVDGARDAADRMAAIAASSKPFCLVLDFVGSTGRHSVATAMDGYANGSVLSNEVKDRIKSRLALGEEFDIASAVAEEIQAEQERKRNRDKRREREAQKRVGIVGAVELSSQDVRLIGLGGEVQETDRNRTLLSGPPLPGQVQELCRLGVSLTGIDTARQARDRLIEVRKKLDLATPKQYAFIQKHQPSGAVPGLTRKKAGYLIGQITKRWRT